MRTDYSHCKQLLLKERAHLQQSLEGLGYVHADDQDDYDATSDEEVIETGDEADHAAHLEEFSSRVMLEAELEKRYIEVHDALDAIKNGTYGVCVFCGEAIPLARLEANPAARTCILHTQSVSNTSSRV